MSALTAFVPPGLLLSAIFERELERAYCDPPRAYHHFGHVLEVLQHVQELGCTRPWQQAREIFLAVLFHDAVYQPGRRDNEARSADLAQSMLERHGMGEGIDLARIRQLIQLTARHGALCSADVDAEAAAFLDCDMAILAAAPDRFADYDAAIAVEYRAVVPTFLFRFQRRRFLRGLLASPRIFLSDAGLRLWEQAARRNLAAALG